MKLFYSAVAACGLLAILGLVLARCWMWSTHPAACVHREYLDWMLSGLTLLHIAVGGWLGAVAARRTRRGWIGWIVGIAATSALIAILTWADLVPISGDGEPSDYEDNSYRR